MNVNDIKAHIKNKTLNNFYVFTGDEWKVQQIYIKHIADADNYDIKYIDTITDVWSSLMNRGLIRTHICYVVRDDDNIIHNETIQKQLNNIKDNMVILLLTNIDKRTKFYKSYKDNIVEFEPLKDDILVKYIKKDINLSTQNCHKLIDICEHNYGRCLLEIDKMKKYAHSDVEVNVDYDIMFTHFIEDGTIYTPPKDAIFEFVDNVLNANRVQSFELFDECIRCGEAVLVMLSVLYTNAKQTLQVQSYNGNNIEKATGLTKWQINNSRKHTNVFSNRELIDIMRLCSRCERDIKTGIIDEQDAMRYVLSTIEW